MADDLDLVGAAEVAEMLNVSRQRVAQLAASADFPKAVATLAAGRIWRRDSIVAWQQANRPGVAASCSFCGKASADVAKLVAGPRVYICNECVDLCVDILFAEEGLGNRRVLPTLWSRLADAGLLAGDE